MDVFRDWSPMKVRGSDIVHLGRDGPVSYPGHIGASKCGIVMDLSVLGTLKDVTCKKCLRELRAHGVDV